MRPRPIARVQPLSSPRLSVHPGIGSLSAAVTIEGLMKTIGIYVLVPVILVLLSNSSAIRLVYAYESGKPLKKLAPSFFSLSEVIL